MSDSNTTGDTDSTQSHIADGQGGEADQTFQYTRCPFCQAVFRVGSNKLAMRQGDVRCGACRQVFNANSHEVKPNALGLFDRIVSKPETLEDETVGKTDHQFDADDDVVVLNQQRTIRDILKNNLETIQSTEQHPDSASIDFEPADGQWHGLKFTELEHDRDLRSEESVFLDADGPVLPVSNKNVTEPDARQPDIDQSAFLVHREPLLNEIDDFQDTNEGLVVDDQEEPNEALSADSEADGATEPDSIEPASVEREPTRQHWFSAEPDPLLDNNPFAEKQVKSPGESGNKTESASAAPPSQFNVQGVDDYIKDRTNPLVTVFWMLVASAFVLLLGLQVKYYFVDQFAQNERYRPYLSAFCKIARCELPARRDSYRFTITNTRIDLHPTEPGALRITVKLLNQAGFSQPYPDLQLTLTDRLGRVVGRRSFKPSFYLESNRRTLLDSGELGTVEFDLAHPHEKAVGFVVDIVRAPANV